MHQRHLIHHALEHLRKTELELFPFAVHELELRHGLLVAEQDGLKRRSRFPADHTGLINHHHAFALQRFGE